MVGLLIQEFKTLIKSPASISILVIPLVLLVGLGYLLPSGWIVPSSITIGIVAAVLLYFGGSIEEIKRTSFMKSVSLTRLSKFTFLATKILFAMIVSMISVLWVLFFSWIFTETPLAFLAVDFSNLLGNTDGVMKVISEVPFKIHWDMVQWAKMLYSGIITIVVAVSLSFVFVAFAKSSLSFYLMSFGYLLAMILFGGVVMPGFLISESNSWFKNLYYLVPNYYTNNIMSNAFSGGILNSVINPLTNVIDDFANNSDFPTLMGIYNADPEMLSFMKLFFNGAENLKTLTIDGVEYDLTTLISHTGWDGSITQLNEFINWFTGLASNGQEIHFETKGILGSKHTFIFDTEMIQSYFNDVNVALDLFSDDIDKVIDISLDTFGLGDYMAPIIPTIAGLLRSVGMDDIAIVVETTGKIGLNGLVPTITNGIHFDPVLQFTSQLRGMFGQLDWWNWPVPWLEGCLFLGISITFFKWS